MTTPHSRPTRVYEVMAKHAPLAASATLRQAAAALQDSRVDGLIVLYDDGGVAGVFGERDLVFAAQAEADGGSDRVGDYVNKRFLRAQEDEAVEDVLQRMSSQGLRRAVVLDRDQSPTGLIAPESLGPAGRGRADFVLEVGGERFGASAAAQGDATLDSASGAPAPRITVGVSTLGALRLERHAGHEARLLTNASLDPTGAAREVARLTLVKIDPESALVVAEPWRPR